MVGERHLLFLGKGGSRASCHMTYLFGAACSSRFVLSLSTPVFNACGRFGQAVFFKKKSVPHMGSIRGGGQFDDGSGRRFQQQYQRSLMYNDVFSFYWVYLNI